MRLNHHKPLTGNVNSSVSPNEDIRLWRCRKIIVIWLQFSALSNKINDLFSSIQRVPFLLTSLSKYTFRCYPRNRLEAIEFCSNDKLISSLIFFIHTKYLQKLKGKNRFSFPKSFSLFSGKLIPFYKINTYIRSKAKLTSINQF